MPSLILTGHPCIGKTTFAHLLSTRALHHPSNTISNVIHVRESTACPDQTKSECYSNSHMEKNTRASLKSEFDRAVNEKGGSSTLVILDSLNYIKGYRYELYCISKAAGERHGVVWVMGSSSDGERTGVGSQSDELAKRRNLERMDLQMKHKDQAGTVESEIDLDGYFEDDEAMDALVLRYEPPDEKKRWENPLYKVDVTSVLPWGKDGTSLGVSDELNNGKDSESNSASLSNQMKAMEVKDTSSRTGVPAKKPVRKSAAGFKRRGKKSTQQQKSTHQPQSTAPITEPTAVTTNVPLSMASRNLSSAGPESGNACGSKHQKMEEIIDSILDSFLTNIAPLQEGMSTLKQVSAESNVLNQVDNLTQRINNEILKAQKAASLSAGVGGKIFILNGDERRAMNLSKPLYMNELRNCRRQFLKWIAGHPMPGGTSEEEMVEGYISYIESNI